MVGTENERLRLAFSLIVAFDQNLAIGRAGTLPWPKLSADLASFRALTTTHAVIMGRRTYLSLPSQVRPLPHRTNVVLTRSASPFATRRELGAPDDVLMAGSLEAAARMLDERGVPRPWFVIGGAEVYRAAMESQMVDKIYVTRVREEYENCDAFFPHDPAGPDSAFTKISQSAPITERNVNYTFEEYVPHAHPNPDEQQYLDLTARILASGAVKPDRTGTGTRSLFGAQMRFSLRNHTFPLLTTKRVFFRGVVEELLWFLRGSTSSHALRDRGVHIWDANGSRDFLDARGFAHRDAGDLGPVYGFQWRHFGEAYRGVAPEGGYGGEGVDQIAGLVEALRGNPHDRRHLLTAWNPAALREMALPPCHVLAQFYVCGEGRELSCQMYQRSCDMGLGVPFNIASYALLTVLMAKVCGYEPGEFVHTMGDAHVYVNHVGALEEQLRREPRAFPKLFVKGEGKTKLEEFEFEDFELVGYDPHGPIKMAMAV